MRHLKRNKKLGRKGDHRNAMLANLVGSLIKHKRVTTNSRANTCVKIRLWEDCIY